MELDWLQGRMEQLDDTTKESSRAGREEGESDRAGESRPPRAFAGAHDWSQDGDGGLELLQRLSSEFPEAAGRLTGRKVFFPSWVEMAMVKSDKTKRWQRRMHRAEVREAKHAADEAQRRKEVAQGVGLDDYASDGSEVSIRFDDRRN